MTAGSPTLHPYSAYKETCDEWFGDVPAHWEVRRTKTLLKTRNEKGFRNEPLLAATQTKGVVRKDQYEHRTVLALKDLQLLKLVREGDFVISLRSFQGGIEYARNQGIISPAYTVLYSQPPRVQPYLALLFKSSPYIENLTLHVTGIRQGQNIDYSELSRSYLPLPPLEEQAAIVRYLGYVDRRVRRYVRAKERLIGLLEEENQAIINQAVTRGLDPGVRLKASAVEWLGDVPEHWEVRRLKRVLHRIIDCEHKTAPAVSASSYRVVRTSAVRGGSLAIAGTYCTSEKAFAEWTRRGYLEPGDVIFTREAPAGEACVVPGNLSLCLGQRTVLMKVDRSVYDPRFLVHMLYAGPPHDEIELASRGSTVPHFNVEDIGALPVLTPPVPEQTAIVRYVDHETAVIDAAITRARRQVELIEEYRTRLIADVVTGKLDVREAAAALPDATEAPDGESDCDRIGRSHEADDQEVELA